MYEDAEASRSIDTDLLSIYVWLYVRFLKYVSISHIFWFCEYRWSRQSGVKATLKRFWCQNAKEPGDACRIPRGAWKLRRCIEHATRWIVYRMEPTFYLVVGANFRPQPLALWVSMTSTIKWRKYSNLFDEICDMTDHDWYCLFWDVQEIDR